ASLTLFSTFIIPVESAPVLSLVLTAAIPSIPADGYFHPAFYVTVQDQSGKPYPLMEPINLTVTCSDERILKLQSPSVMKAATYYAIINASSTVTTKSSVEVTVSSPGLQSSKVNAVTEPSAGSPTGLKVTLLPSTVLPRKNDISLVVVTLVDAYGKPTRAREDMQISLISSNTQIAELSGTSIKIPKGEFSAKVNIICKGLLGTSTITASASGIRTDSSTFTVAGPKPERLYIWTLSRQMLGERYFVFVGVVDSNNRPVKLISPMTVSLFSSEPTVFSFARAHPVGKCTITIPEGEWAGMAEIQCNDIGSASIYAIAEDLTSQAITVTGVYTPDPQPTKLNLQPLARNLPADERNYTAMVVQLVDNSNNPVAARYNIEVLVTSSSTDIFDTKDRVIIPEGRSYANITGIPRYLGTVSVSAGSPGLLKGDSTVTVYAPVPTAVTITTPPIPSEGEVDACLVISAGIPVQAQENISILLSSSDPGIGDSDSYVMLPRKEYMTYFKVRGHAPGKFYLTASGSGIPTAQPQLEVLEAKPSTFAFSYVKPIKNYNFPVVIQLTSLTKNPSVTNEPVTVTLTSHNLSNVVLPEKVTISSDRTEALFYGKALTTTKTKLTISSEGFKTQTAEITPAPINVELKIISGDRYPTGQSVTLKASVTLDNNPVKGITVYWNGSGLAYVATITDSSGIAQNQLTVRERDNRITAFIDIGGAGRFVATKNIVGSYAAYRLEVSSNVQVEIKGSGDYAYGQRIQLTAPETVAMPGIVGLLGGRYVFQQWQGAITSSNPSISISITGEQETIAVRAFYIEDISPMFTSIGILAGVAVAIVLIVFFLRRIRRPSIQRKG
ncbi:MAG: Ig-like domain-containing protein, partial [Nitrososphaerota archaeon]